MPGDFDGVVAAVTGGGSHCYLAVDGACRVRLPANRGDERARAPGDLPPGWSGLRVSRLGLGAAPLGNLFTKVQEPDADATVDAALGAGITFVDTAPHYASASPSARLYRLAQVPRDRFVLSTKVGLAGPPARGGRDGRPGGFVATPAAKRWTSPATGAAVAGGEPGAARPGPGRRGPGPRPRQPRARGRRAAYPALVELRDQGVVQAIGAGMNQAEMLTRFVRELDLDLVLMAGRYSLLDQGALAELLPACVERGVAVVIGGVSTAGCWPPRPGNLRLRAGPAESWSSRAGRLQAVCARHGVPLRAAALAFPSGHPAVASVLVGARTAAEVQDAVAMVGRPVPAEL